MLRPEWISSTMVYERAPRCSLFKPNKSRLAVAILQNFLDGYLKNHRGQMDYIHGEEALKNLAEKENAVGFLLPAMEKESCFLT